MASCTAGVAAAATAVAGGELFDYNRENYLYDRKMRLETEYKIMDYRIKKVDLHRQDISDIVALTAVKMDTYLIVNAVQLGFVVMAFCEGRLAPGSPAWLVGAHTLCMAASFSYYLMAVFFAMHATVASKSYEVRMLTQWVRLPIPSWAQLEGARTYASTFEKVEARQMFRVPFAMGKQEEVLEASKGSGKSGASEFCNNAGEDKEPTDAKSDTVVKDDIADSGKPNPKTAMPSGDASDPWGLERPGEHIYELDGTLQTDPRKLKHIQLVREAMTYWQAYDGFARVTMSMGTNQLVQGLSYYVLGYVLASNHAIVASWLAVVLFSSITWGIIRIDMSLTVLEYCVAVPLGILGPLLTCPCVKIWAQDELHDSATITVLMPIVYLVQSCWFLFILYAVKVVDQNNGVILPTGFRSVLYLDVFGWMQKNVTGANGNKLSHCLQDYGVLSSPEETNGTGPSIQSVRYDKHGRPVPMRVEQLPGASRQQRMQDLTKADFKTTTFVPCERDEDPSMITRDDVEPNAGGRPWRIFRGATSMLACLWFLSGLMIASELWGFTSFELNPLLVQPGNHLDASETKKLEALQSGKALKTSWPHANVKPVGLTCGGSGNTIVASTQFGLYTAHLSDVSAKQHAHFKAAPMCEHIQGEALQDVSLRCGPNGSTGACHAVVLHKNGQRVAGCALGGASANATSVLPPTNIAEEFLRAKGAVRTETAVALAVTSECEGKVRDCAYVGTSSERIVEMKRAAGGSQEWFPTRLLQATQSSWPTMSSGSIHVINGRYLGVLSRDGDHIQVLDLHKDGAAVNSWQLPEHQHWGSMCAAGNSLYFLSKGASPEVWRFPVPQQLRHDSTGDEQEAGTEAKDDATSLLSQQDNVGTMRHKNRQAK